MQVYRIISARHSDHLLDGSCAARSGGRWNQRGTPVVYTSLSVSLAILEAMHQEDGDLTGQHCLGVIDVPATGITHLDRGSLPPRWRDLPYQTQVLGTQWLASGTVALLVPSAIHDHEDNLVLNPLHPDFSQVIIESCQPLHIWERLCRQHDLVKTDGE